MYTASQYRRSSEQNLFGILCITLVMIFISGLLTAVLELLGEITVQQAECPFACVTYVNFIHKIV